MYKKVDVFSRTDEALKVYRCFQSLESELYFVLSCDNFYPPFKTDQIGTSQQTLLDLMFDEDIKDRTEGFGSLKEAIKIFDSDFSDFGG